MKNCLFLAFSSFLLLLCFKVNCQNIIAQVNTYDPYSSISCMNTADEFFSDNISIGQSFKSQISSTFSSIQFEVYSLFSAGTVSVEVYSCTGPTAWGSLLGTKSGIAINGTGIVSADVSSLNIPVTKDNYYGFRIVPDLGFDAAFKVDNNVYPDGSSWGSIFSFGPANDLTFTASGNSALPVTLASFTAQKQNNQVLLKWSTASEQNAKNFIVQKSGDGILWYNIGTVLAHGNSNTLLQYSFQDNAPRAGMNYYRLLQTDIDEKYSYSAIKAIQFSNEGKGFTLLANPISNGQIELKVFKPMVFRLYDGMGKLIWTKKLGPGIQSVGFNTLNSGIYFLKGNDIAEKIVMNK